MNDITNVIKKTDAVWCYNRDPEVLDRIVTVLSNTFPLRYTGTEKGNVLIITKNLECFYYLGESSDLEFGLFPDLEFQFTKDLQELINIIRSWISN